MPKTSNINRLLTDVISQEGLTGVYVGVQAQSTDSVSVYGGNNHRAAAN